VSAKGYICGHEKDQGVDANQSHHKESALAQRYAAGFSQPPTIHDPIRLPPGHRPAPSSVVLPEEPHDSKSDLEL
jgi:hypothetical protein